MKVGGPAGLAIAALGAAFIGAYGCGGTQAKALVCPHPPSVGPLSSINPQAGSGQAIGRDPVFFHMEGYTGSESGPGSFVQIRNKRGEGYFIKLFTVLSRPIVGRVRQKVSALEPGKRIGFEPPGGLAADRKPRMSELLPYEDRHLTTKTFPLLPGGIWVSAPGCYRLVHEGPGFRNTIDFPVGLVR
jgi:hypothetical protein